MQVKVIKQFADKEAGKVLRKVGKTFEASDERAQELIEKGYVVEADRMPESTEKEEGLQEPEKKVVDPAENKEKIQIKKPGKRK